MDRLYLLQDLISDPEADPVAVSKAASLVDAAIYIPEVKLLVTKFPLLINIFVSGVCLVFSGSDWEGPPRRGL